MIAIFESTDRRCSTRVYSIYIYYIYSFLQTFFFFLKLDMSSNISFCEPSDTIKSKFIDNFSFFFFIELPYIPIPFCQGIQKTASYWWNIIF